MDALLPSLHALSLAPASTEMPLPGQLVTKKREEGRRESAKKKAAAKAAAQKTRFKPQPHQLVLMQAVRSGLDQRDGFKPSLLCKYGTGTGKTMAVPGASCEFVRLRNKNT